MASYLLERIDIRTVAATGGLVVIGLISIYSATYDAKMSELYMRQLVSAGIGVVALVVAALTPLRTLQRISFPSYFLSLLLLVTVLLIGKQVSGSTSWFQIGPFSLQPSEFAKVTTVLALAVHLSRSDVNLSRSKDALIPGLILIAPVVLILRQPDTGTAMIFFGMFLPILFWGGSSLFTLLALVSPGVVAVAALIGPTPFLISILGLGALLWMTKKNTISASVVFSFLVLVGISVQSIHGGLKPYQQKRIETFLDPGADPLGAGYNVLQSKIAIGSGGLFGRGFLEGTQTQLNFIPAQWTDFIFCVPGEEFGFLGAAIIIILFALLLFSGVRIATVVKNPYGSFVAIGVTGIFATHIFMNIGMAIGLAPVVGIPLPFLSYGGSALIADMIMIGLLLNVYAHRKEY
ncbi:MAG: rod shape-determining protein RodA [Bacteroidetes bacterium]|nr:rod shape-determining protein RodA [Bacteroidota bacterium]MCW5895712.1 rod shape-determining protein RodA [Bacteroidota bacterium]